MNAAEVGDRIAALRKEKGLTQKQLAESLQLTDKAVSKWERRLNFPDLTSIEPLAACLGVSPVVLLGLEEKNAEEVLSASAELYEQERVRWLRELKSRSLGCILLCLLLFAAVVWLSRILYDQALLGWPQTILGTCYGLIGCMCGNFVFILRSANRQLRQASGKHS